MEILESLQDVFVRVWDHLVGRLHGPLSLRFVLQPSVAILLAVRDGTKDAREGRPPVFWTILTDPIHRGAHVREALSATSRVILLGLVMEVIYQLFVLRSFYPGEALIVVGALAFLPYLFARGIVNRFMTHWHARHDHLRAHAPKK